MSVNYFSFKKKDTGFFGIWKPTKRNKMFKESL